MEDTYKKINSIWDRSGFLKPSIVYCLDSTDKMYLVARDQSNIVTLVVKYGRKIYTYVIPKVYLTKEKNGSHYYYKLKNSTKLNIISCSNNQIDEMANFVAINIINKI
jgi:hypothetical protein